MYNEHIVYCLEQIEVKQGRKENEGEVANES